jgi:hypothetical protein
VQFSSAIGKPPRSIGAQIAVQLLRGLPDLKGSAGACDVVKNKGAFRLGLKTNRCAVH